MSDIRSQVQQFYNEAGGYFSKTRQKTYGGKDATWVEVRSFIKNLPSKASVLDLGCGNGRLLTGLPENIHYTGVDFSTTLLGIARKLHPTRRFIYGDISKPSVWREIGEARYDAIFSIATLHHIPERSQQLYILRQVRKKLRKNGLVYISVWNLWQWRYLNFQLKSIRMKTRNIRWVNIPFANKWERFCFSFDKSYMRELVNNAGLKIEKIYYADKMGEKSEVRSGKNLVVIACAQESKL